MHKIRLQIIGVLAPRQGMRMPSLEEGLPNEDGIFKCTSCKGLRPDGARAYSCWVAGLPNQGSIVTPLRILLFGLISLLLAPISILGFVAYMATLLLLNRRNGISGTAYEPFMGRMMMHDVGDREDVAAKKLSVTLPALPHPIWSLLMGPTMLAGRLSGYFPEAFRYPAPRPAGLASAMGIRTEFFDRTLLASLKTVQQVVILGAGWDTRAYSLLLDWGHPVFEVDAPATQRAKMAALQKAGIDSSRVTFVEVDFNRQSWLERLEKHGFDPSRPTHLIWEGVTMYLEEEAITETLRTVSSFPPGSTLAFDYFARQLVKAEPPLRLIGMIVTASIRWFYGESMVFGFDMEPPAKDKITARLGEHDLDLLDYEILSGEEKGKIALYGFALASPAG